MAKFIRYFLLSQLIFGTPLLLHAIAFPNNKINNKVRVVNNLNSFSNNYKHLVVGEVITTSTGGTTLCPGGTLILNANPAPTNSSYHWIGPGLDLTTNDAFISISAIGTYVVYVTTNGSTITYPTITITPAAVPTAAFSHSLDGQCSPSTITFTSNSTGNNLTYLWDFGDGSTSTDQNPSHSFSATAGCGAATFIVKLTATNSEGCSNTISGTVSVLRPPDVAIEDADPFGSFSNCRNNPSVSNPNYTLKINNTSPSSSCINSYSVDWGDGQIQNILTSSNFPLTHTYTQLGAFNLIVTGIGSNGCQSAKSYSVANQSNPAGGLVTLGGTSNLCAPAQVPFVISNWQSNSPGTTYLLDFGDGSSITLMHPLNSTMQDEKIYHTYTTSSCPSPTFIASLKVSNVCATTPFTAGNIVILTKPAAAFTFTPNPVCLGQQITFNNTSTAGYYISCSRTTTYSWDFGDPSSAANTSTTVSPTHNYANPGTYTVTLTAGNPCGSDVITHTVIVNSLPTMTSPTTATICSGTTVSIPLISDIPASYSWVASNNTNVSGESLTIQSTSTLSNTLINNTTSVQVVTYTVTPRSTTGGCSGTPQTVKVTVNPALTAPTVTSPVNYCQGATSTALSATATTGNTVYWYTSSSGGTGNTSNPTPSTTNTGTYNFYVGQTSNTSSCESPRSLISVIVSAIPVAPTVSSTPLVYCQGGSATVLSATASTGNTLKWYTVPTGGVASTTAPIPGLVIAGSTTYYVSQQSVAGCESPRSSIEVVVNALPNAPAATTPINYCQNATASALNATADPGNSLKWYTVSTGGTPSNNAIVPSTTTAGTKTYYVSQITSSGCESARASISVTVTAPPAKPVVITSVIYCLNDITQALTATALPGNSLTWYNSALLAGGSTSVPTPATLIAGTTTFYVTQSNASGCESLPSTITVTVNPLIAGNTIGADQTICSATAPNILTSAATVSGGSGSYSYQWQNSVDNGFSWNNITGAVSASYAPPTLTANTQYKRIVSSGNCLSTSNAIIITVQGTLANYDINAAQTICSGTIPALITGSVPTGGNGSFTFQWESSANNSTWLTITGAINNDYQPATLSTSTYYRRKIFSGICSSASASILITVNPVATVSPVSNQFFCNGANASAYSFSGTPTTGVTYAWVNDNPAIGLGASGTGNLSAFIAVNASKTPQVAHITVTPTYTGTGVMCIGTPLSFTITVLPTITIAQTPNLNYCAGDAAPVYLPVNDAATFTGGSVSYSWAVSGSAIGLSSGTGNQVPGFTTVNSGTSDLVTTVQVIPIYQYNGHSCNGSPMSYTITVNPKPTTASAGLAAKICDISYTLQGNTPTAGTGNWTVSPSASVSFDNVAMANATASGLQKGTRYQFTWTISNHTCVVSSANVTIDVLADITNTIQADVTTTCPNQTVNLSTLVLTGGDVPATLTASYSYVWESSANGTSGWQTINGQTAAGLSVTPVVNTYYRRKVKSYTQCEVISNVIPINVNASAPIAAAGSAITLCSEAQAQLQGNDPGSGFVGTWSDTVTGSTLTFSPDAHTYNAMVNGLGPGTTYNLVWSIASPSCGTSTSALTITDLPTLVNTISPAVSTICLGQPINIIGAQPTGGTGTYTYSWETSADQITWSAISSQTGQNLTFSPTTSRYIRRTVFSGICSIISTTVQVIVQHALANNAISSTQQVCTGKTVTAITGSLPTGGDGTYFYQWQQSADQLTWSNITSATGIDFQPQPLTQTTYYRRVVNSALCSGPQSNISLSVTITVNGNAHAEFSATAQTACIPFNLGTVIKPVAHNDVNSLYQWYANGVLIGTGSAFPGYTITTDGQSVTIKLLATSKFGCDTNSASLIFSTQKNVIAAFTKDQVKGCGPLTVNFTNTSVPLIGATYSWDFGNGQTSAQAQSGAIIFNAHPLNRDTTYVITLKASTSCGVNIYKDSVTVRPKPKAIFTPDKTIGCSPFTVNITNQSRGVPNTYTYSLGDGVKKTVTDNQAIQYTYNTIKTDTLTLKLYAQNECGIDSSSYKIVVYPNTVQANLVVNGTNKTGCAPFTVRFDNNSTGANTFFYDYADGSTAATTTSPETQTHTFTQPGTYVVKLTASNGCSTASTNQTITVLAQPVVNFNVNQLQYCVKDSAIFSNTTASLASFSYIWDFGDGITSNQIQPKHTYATAGNYTVKLTAVQNAPGATCSATVSHQVTILPLPIASFSSNAAGLNCAPFTLTVNATPANASSVSWNFGDPSGSNNTASGYSATHTFAKAGLYAIKQIAYNQTGCLDSTMQVLKVTESPKVAFTTKDTIICGNSATLLFKNGTTYGGQDLVNYNWYVNGALVSNQKDLTYNFTAPAGTILPYSLKIKLVAYSTIGCPDSAKHTVIFNPLPVASYTISNLIGCAPFTVGPVNTSSYADSYKWYLNNVLVSTVKSPVNIIFTQPNQSYILKLVTTNIYACNADSISRTVSTYPKPTAGFSLADSVSCTGSLAIQVSNTTTGAISYTWNFGDSSAESSASIPTHTYGVPGVYALRLVAFNGTCRDTMIRHIEIANPVKSAFTANLLKGCTQITTTFQNLAVNATSYLWDFGDGTTSTVKNPVHVFTYNGSPFTIKLTAYGDYACNDQSVQVNYITVTAPPVTDFSVSPDSVINIPNHTFNFKDLSTGGTIYNWDFGDGQSGSTQNITHTYADTGSYKVRFTVTNTQGCQSVKTRTVKISGVPQYLYVPNAFEPGNARTSLRTFGVLGTGLAEYQLRIYNKWGQLIYQTDVLDSKGSPTQGWDGTMNGQPAPQGIYVWQIHARFVDGTYWHGMQYNAGGGANTSGSLTLMR